MKVVIIGLGIQGKKRLAVAGPHVTATVDPFVATADFKNIEQVPLDRYEAAVVSTPDQQKIAILRYLLANGKHVLVEKPLLADNPEDFRQLQTLADKAGTTCWTAYNHRFEPNLVKLREVIRSGVLGKIYHARFFYGNGTAADVRRSPWRDQGLGVIPDLGSHLFDLTDYLLDVRPQRIEPWACDRFENQAYDHVLLGARSGGAASSVPGSAWDRTAVEALPLLGGEKSHPMDASGRQNLQGSAVPGRAWDRAAAPLGMQPALQYEMSLLSWRNSFHAEITAEKGSAQVHCLCKWGPSSLIVRRRIFPSGKPTEEVQTVEKPDPTWEAEYAEFLKMCAKPCTSLAKDMWINSLFHDLQHQMRSVSRAA